MNQGSSKWPYFGRIARNIIRGLAAIGLLGASWAYADTTDQLLDQLKAKGILTRTEYKKLKARHASEIAARKEKSPYAGPPVHRVVTKEGVIEAPDDRYVTRLNKGVGVKIGAVDVSLVGDITFFGTEVFNPKNGPFVAGALMTPATNSSFSIRGGLPPSALVVTLSTNQMGYDLSATFGFYIGGTNIGVGLINANSPGAPVGLGTPGVDVRQVFGTIGTPDFGTVKIGRDIGLFGADAIFNDDTIFGAGVPYFNEAPRNTTLGRIGYGYLYADYMPQVTYTTPNFFGFTASIGAFTPLEEFNFSGESGTMTGHDQPMFQGRIKYVNFVAEQTKLTAWASALTQQQRVEVGDAVNMAPGTSIRAYGADAGVRLDIGPASFLGSGYYGTGLGTSALFFDGVTLNGIKRNSYGGYVQGSYLFFDRLKLGASYGISLLEAVYGDPGTLIRSEGAYIGFARYKLTDWYTLESEFIHTNTRNQLGQSYDNNAVILGSTLVF